MKLPEKGNPLLSAVASGLHLTALGLKALGLGLYALMLLFLLLGLVVVFGFILVQGSQHAALQIGEPARFVSVEEQRSDCGKILICSKFGDEMRECSLGSEIEKCVSLRMKQEEYEFASSSCSDRGQVIATSITLRWSKLPTPSQCTFFSLGYFGLIGNGDTLSGSQRKDNIEPRYLSDLDEFYPGAVDGAVVRGRNGEIVMKSKGGWRVVN